VVIGDRCFLGSASVISSNIRLSENIIVGAGAVVVNNFDECSIVIAGVPAKRKGPVSSHKGVPERSAAKQFKE
jgi:UDP-3-O-[3-hydroxymyristoyl] glucosamine N-acyltransferase